MKKKTVIRVCNEWKKSNPTLLTDKQIQPMSTTDWECHFQTNRFLVDFRTKIFFFFKLNHNVLLMTYSNIVLRIVHRYFQFIEQQATITRVYNFFPILRANIYFIIVSFVYFVRIDSMEQTGTYNVYIHVHNVHSAYHYDL